jgi:cytochrome d ubiquinol oxidase subunit II
MTWATFAIQPHVPDRLFSNPAGLTLPVLALAALVATRWFDGRGREFEAFLASCGFIVLLLLSAVFGLYPFLLPSNVDPAMGLSVHNAATAPGALRTALHWFAPGFALIAIYFWYIYSRLAGKIPAEEEA